MISRQIVLFSILLLGLSCSGQLSLADNIEKISIPSYTPQTIHDIRSGNWQIGSADISGELSIPDRAAPVPAVIVVHGSGHVRNLSEWNAQLRAKLSEAGIAMLTIDSYSGRGISATTSNQGLLSKAARVVDAFEAFAVLRQNPHIDAGKIGITGYSFGGIVSLLATDRKISDVLAGHDRYFAASLPVYPSCMSTWRTPTPTPAPMLILAGEKDDYTWAKYCVAYAERMQALGYPVSIKVYPDTHHNWINTGSDTVLTNAWHFNECAPAFIDDDGHEAGLGGEVSSRDLGWKRFIRELAHRCGRKGVTLRYQKAAHDDALLTTVRFFAQHLQ